MTDLPFDLFEPSFVDTPQRQTDIQNGPAEHDRYGSLRSSHNFAPAGSSAIKLTDYLKNYSASFSRDLDQLWIEWDHDHNGWLDRDEAFSFVRVLSDCIDDLSRVQTFSRKSFDAIFDKFDEDNNGFLEKAEMAVLIKQVFKRPEWLTRGEEKQKVVKQKDLSTLLGSYRDNFCIDVDALWEHVDYDGDQYLDRMECRAFMNYLVQFTSEEKARNYSEMKFVELF